MTQLPPGFPDLPPTRIVGEVRDVPDWTMDELIRLPSVSRLMSKPVRSFEHGGRVWFVGWNGAWVKAAGPRV